MGRVKVDYSNKIILNDYGNEVKILELYEQRKRASYWKYICPYCGKEDVNDISKIKKAKTCKHCREEYLLTIMKNRKGNIVHSQSYLENKKNKFYDSLDCSHILLIDEYISPSIKLKYKCKNCNTEFQKYPREILKLNHCTSCDLLWDNKNNPKPIRQRRKIARKTTDIFKQEVYNLCKEEFTVLGEYINANTKIKMLHNKCNKTFDMKPSNFLSGQRCPYCRYNIIADACRISDDDFKKEVYDLVQDEYYVKTAYVNRNTKVLFHHNICDSDFWMTPSAFVHAGSRCTNKKCLHNRLSLAMKDSPEEFQEKFNKQSNGEYILLSDYHSSNEKVLIKHNECGNSFWISPNRFLQGQGCSNSECIRKRIREKRAFTEEEFIQQLNTYNDSLSLLSNYTNMNTKVTMQCKKCNYIWDVNPSNLLYDKTSCPKCKTSHGERVISKYLDNNNIIYEYQKKFDSLLGVGNGKLSYDFYLPNENMLIEFQGKQHYKPVSAYGGEEQFKVQQEHDRRKRQYANDNNIKLLEIPYWDYENIEEILTRELGLLA